MKIGLKTTIFWNITLLMTAAIILISFVVLRVTEREILKQRTETGEAVFSMIVSSLPHLKDQNTESNIAYSKIQPFITGLVDDKICSRILLVNNQHLVIADTKNKKKRALYR
jgi:hypothetical protein